VEPVFLVASVRAYVLCGAMDCCLAKRRGAQEYCNHESDPGATTAASCEMKAATITLAEPAETGALGVQQLKRLWSRAILQRQGQPAIASAEAHVEHVVLDALGMGLEQTMQHLFRAVPSFAEFEQWIIQTTGGVSATQVARINAMLTGAECPPEIARWLAEVEADAPVLSAADVAFWDEHGYVIVQDAVPEASRAAATRWRSCGAGRRAA